LLDAVQPEAVVISSAYDSRYGHPNEETLQRLADRSIPTYWTATHGDIVLVSDGQGMTVRTQQTAPTDPSALRDRESVTPGTTGAGTDSARLAGDPADGATPPGDTDTATPTATPVVTDGGTRAEHALAVAEIHADAAGTERENLNDEYVVLENTGDTTVDLSGWTLSDAADHTYTFPEGVTLAPDARVTVHTGSGTDTETDLYWGSGAPIWNNDGDTVIVRTGDGTIVLEVEY
jgi:competence protein ComEC